MLSSKQLSELWNRHSAALLLVARGHCGAVLPSFAEDCVQEAFVRLAALKKDPDSAAGWLMICVRNSAIDAVRSQLRRTKREAAAAESKPQWFQPHRESTGEDHVRLQQTLNQLDQQTRDIVIGHLWNDMTFRQLAEVVELSSATVHRRYEDGIEQMRNLMTDSNPSKVEAVQ